MVTILCDLRETHTSQVQELSLQKLQQCLGEESAAFVYQRVGVVGWV